MNIFDGVSGWILSIVGSLFLASIIGLGILASLMLIIVLFFTRISISGHEYQKYFDYVMIFLVVAGTILVIPKL